MKSRVTLYMTLVVIAGFAIIMAINAVSLLGISQAKYLSPSDVRGMAVEHDGLLYTLNFEQQNACIDIFNRATPISTDEAKPRMKQFASKPAVSNITIYRFNAPDIEVKLVGFVTKTYSEEGSFPVQRQNLVLSVPLWNPNGYIEEKAQDQLQELLANTYDS